MLWTDSEEAPSRIERVADLETRARLQAMRDTGLVSFPGLIPPTDCDRIVADFERFCEAHPEEAERFRLPNGFHSRFYNLHTISDAALQAALNPMVLELLDHLFTRRAALNSTHFFEQGSEQAIHRDTPFFYTDPLPGEFTGAWFALEEVDIEAGPLVYGPRRC
jgi:Phytanoyl-CoA dioxygenase (PhyH)